MLPFEAHAYPMPRRRRHFLRLNGALKLGVSAAALALSSLIVYITFLSPRGSFLRLSDWQAPSYFDPNSGELADPRGTSILHTRPVSLLPEPAPVLDEPPASSPSPSLVSEILTLEQIKDVVNSTRGFFSRDYSLGLGWNNVSATLVGQVSA